MEVLLGIAAAVFAIKWLRAVWVGKAAALMLEHRGIHPTDEEIKTCLSEVLRRKFRCWH